jgi:hypothetical protein
MDRSLELTSARLGGSSTRREGSLDSRRAYERGECALGRWLELRQQVLGFYPLMERRTLSARLPHRIGRRIEGCWLRRAARSDLAIVYRAGDCEAVRCGVAQAELANDMRQCARRQGVFAPRCATVTRTPASAWNSNSCPTRAYGAT